MIERYLDEVCAQVRWREAHAEIRRELACHIADLTEALVASGLSEAEATAEAVRQMGDPAEVGQGLHRVHRPRTDWVLVGLTVALVGVGLWTMWAGSVSAFFPAGFLGLQARSVALGTTAGLVFWFLDYRRLGRYGWVLIAGVLGLIVLTSFPIAGWRGPVLSLLSHPLLLAPGLAALFARWDWERRGSGWLAAALGVAPVMLYAMLSQLLHGLLYLAVFGVLLVLSRPRWRRLAGPGVLGLGALAWLAYAILRVPHRQERLLTFLMPWRDPSGVGYMTLRSLETLRAAGPWGHGLHGAALEMPASWSELVFPFFVHLLGWVGGAALCAGLLLFLVRVGRLAARSRDRFGFFLVVGILTGFAVETVWNLAMAVGLAPMAGVGLPFISFGGGQIIQLAAVGLLLSVFRRQSLPVADHG